MRLHLCQYPLTEINPCKFKSNKRGRRNKLKSREKKKKSRDAFAFFSSSKTERLFTNYVPIIQRKLTNADVGQTNVV